MIWQRMPLSSAIFLRGSATPRRRCLVAGQPADGADDVDGSDLDIIDNEMCVRSLCFAVTAMSAEWVAGADDVASQCGRESTDSS
jgi:hypothetical protein